MRPGTPEDRWHSGCHWIHRIAHKVKAKSAPRKRRVRRRATLAAYCSLATCCSPDRPGEQQVAREQYAASVARRRTLRFRGADFAFTLCAIRWIQWQPECHRSSGVPGRMVHDDLEPDQTQSHPVGQFFYVIGFGEFQATEQLLSGPERETLCR